MEDWMTTGVHLDITQYALDVETSEWEYLGEFSVLQLVFQEENLSLSCTNVSVFCDYITLMVDHKASLVNSHVLATFIFSSKQLDPSVAISVENSHNFLDFESLSLICVEFRHQSTELLELFCIKAL